MALPLIFDFYNSIITVPAPDTSLEMQFLINEVRSVEVQYVPGMGHPQIAEAAGKFPLGNDVYTGITVKLLGSWRIKFEDRLGPNIEIMTVTGGNLVGGPGNQPIAPSANVQVIQQSSAASTIAIPSTAAETINLKYMVAALTGNSRAVGNIYYWDPVNGNDTYTGLQPTGAVKTFLKAHDLVQDGHQDVIFCLSSDPSGMTVVNDNLAITKDGLKLRGPGHIFRIIPTDDTRHAISVSAKNVEISGLYVTTPATGQPNAITISGDSFLIKDCWITGARSSGITVVQSSQSKIQSCVIENCGLSGTGAGVNLSSFTEQCVVSQCIIFDSYNGVSVSGANLSGNVIENSLIYHNTNYGITIGPSVLRTTVRGGNTIVNNIVENTHDQGTDTYIESTADNTQFAATIADRVWDEVIADHNIPGTAGRNLKDIRTKATLASLSK